MCACPGEHKPLAGARTCEEACYGRPPTTSPGSTGGDYSGAEEAGRRARRAFDCKVLGKNCPEDETKQRLLREAYAANERGVELYKKRDWANAHAAFQEAVAKNPDDPVMRQNLANAQQNLEDAQRVQRAEQQARDSAARMNRSIQDLAQSLNQAPAAAGGLDFDLRDAPNSPTKQAASAPLDFTASVAAPARPAPSRDPRVVDSRVPRDGAYLTSQVPELKNSPAADRIDKGFQAVINHDWPVALAWWQDALNRDPNNAALKRSVDLAQWMVDKRKATAPGLPSPLGVAIHSASRGDYPEAIRQFELAKRENPAIAAQADSMIAALRQRQTREASDARTAEYWSREIENNTQKFVDDLFEDGMNMLSIGNERGAKKAFDDATFFGGNIRPSQVSGPR